MSFFVTAFIGYVTLLVTLIILYFYLLKLANASIDENYKTEIRHTNNPVQIKFAQNGIVDCIHTRLPCVTDRQCRDNCSLQNAVGGTVCFEGFCSSQDLNVANRPDDFVCDPRLGLINVFVASEFVMDQICISLYRDVVDDLGEPRPYLCDNGVLDLDLASRQFTANDCTCAARYTKMLFNQTALARTIPVCIPDAAINVYSKIYSRNQ